MAVKKLYLTFFITLLLTVSSLAQQVSCKGVNTPDARFIINDDTIILSESAGSMTFDTDCYMRVRISSFGMIRVIG